MTRPSVLRHVPLAALAFALAFTSLPAGAQQGNPVLTIATIGHNGPLRVGTNTFRVTVRNGSQTASTPSREPVVVKLVVLDPQQKRTEYEGRITNGVAANSSQNVGIPGVVIAAPGAHTILAEAYVPDRPGRAPIRSETKTEVFTVGGPRDAEVYQLTVTVRNQRGLTVQGVRVAIKTQDGQELDWKTSTGTGEARFPRLAASPAGRPYIIEVKRAANFTQTFEFLMPAQNAVFEAKTTLQ